MSKKRNVEKIDLNSIKDPKFLKNLSYEELDLLSNDIRNKILNMVSNNGGHLSSNLGIVELTIGLHRVFDLSNDKLIFDVGHQCYAHKILTGRNIETIGKENGISGFQKMNESVYDCFEAGHSSTSISAANGFAIARDLDGENYDVIALCGDGAIASGLSAEGLNNIANSNHKVIIVLNDNGMSISKPVGGLAKTFTNISTSKGYLRAKNNYSKVMHRSKFGLALFNASSKVKNWIKRILVKENLFTILGFSYIGPIDGNNIKQVEKALKRAKNTKKSVVIHALTLKGKGYKPAEVDQTGYWHGVTPFDIKTGKPKDYHEGYISWSHIFSDFTEEMLEKHSNSVLISPATIKGAGLDTLNKKYSKRIFDVGICEEHALTLASALSLNEKHPIISIYSSFLQRAYDEFSHDLARMNCNSTILIDRSGFIGSSGETHQGIYDEAYLSTIPNVVLTMPSNIEEAEALYEESFNNHGPFCIRYPRDLVKKQDHINKINLEFGKWIRIKNDSNKLVVIGVGPLLRKLESEIENSNIKCTLINAIYLNKIDFELVDSLLDTEKIVIYNPYSTRRGLVDSLMAYLLEKKFKGSISAHFIPNEFVKQGTIEQQLDRYKLNTRDIISELKK